MPFILCAMPKYSLLILSASVALLLTVVWALTSGPFPLPIKEIGGLLWQGMWGAAESTAPPEASAVIFSIRLPRLLAALSVGATLAAAGATFQNLFRNPLVSPDILGVSSGAALGAMLGLLFALPLLWVQGLAFAGGLLAVALVVLLSQVMRAHETLLALVLIGVVAGSLFGAGVALVKMLADPFNQLPAMNYWLLGSFTQVTLNELRLALPLMMIAVLPLFLLRWRINLLALGDDEAQSLGLSVVRTRWLVMGAATFASATAVAICGVIGWVGLVVPHAVRLLIGGEFSRLLPLSMLVGATFTLVVDTLGRNIAPVELPPGVLTAALGAPLFLWLMTTTMKKSS